MTDYSKKGSVDDIRISLGHIDPQTRSECLQTMFEITRSIESENKGYNRQSVITMFNAKLKYLSKRLLLLPNANSNGKVHPNHS